MIKILETLLKRWFHKCLFIPSYFTTPNRERVILALECKYCSNVKVFPVELED